MYIYNSVFARVVRVLREKGLISLIRKGTPFIWNSYISNIVPKHIVNYNGIKIKKNRRFASIAFWSDKKERRPNYESGTIAAIDKWVNTGDNVIIIGGGWGVTATKAAKKVSPDGRVSVFEGAASEVSKIIETAKLNGFYEIITINHAIVGPKINLRGNEDGANHISPTQLSDCDVLELDCEGSELDILKNIDIYPRVIIVESHGYHGASSFEISKILEDKGYKIQSKVVADKGLEDVCKEKDIYCLTAVRSHTHL